VSECLICNSQTSILEDFQIKVTYLVCENCGFIFKDYKYHPSKEEELEQYKFHNNSFESKGYVEMFENLIRDYIKPLNVSGKVLEYGSGPGPVLKELLIRDGNDVYDYDPIFNDNDHYLNHKYQLITSTEVAEHFKDPLKEFSHLFNLLDDNGYLVIMTRLRNMNLKEFLNWWYRRDITHLSFYTTEAFIEICKKFNFEIILNNKINVIILQKI